MDKYNLLFLLHIFFFLYVMILFIYYPNLLEMTKTDRWLKFEFTPQECGIRS